MRWLVLAREALSTLVLFVVWAVVFTPLAVLARFLRGDVLDRPDASCPSYWRVPEADDPDGLVAFFASRGKLWLVPVVLLLLALGVLLVLSETSAVFAFLYPLF